jgi:two-component system, OmpR family, phosphate regulon sensor histidine kinase PhoR
LLATLPFVALVLERGQTNTLAERLLGEARVAGSTLPWTAGAALDGLCARVADELGVRLTVIASDGRVLGESGRPSATMENHAERPEVREALAAGVGRSVRTSTTVGERLLYVAWRQQQGGEARVVRVAVPLQALSAQVAHVRRVMFGGIALASLLGFGFAVVLSRRMLRRIQRLVDFARRLAGGETPYLAPERDDDLGVLEEQLGEMAREIASTIAALRMEQDRLEAILRGMIEGVVVTDLAGDVVLTNARARDLLGVPEGFDVRGRPLIELARDPELAGLVHELASGAALASRDVELGGAGRTLQVNAARLCGADGRVFGFVLVLHDVTELRRLEVVRRDFVANVSHELRTPLTAIKGYAETLLGPAGDDRDTARRFLEVVNRHSERLGRLIDDLLTLSDLELGRTALRLAPLAVGPAVDDVLQILAARAARAEVHLAGDVAPDATLVLADGDRLRQVLINLVDNAVKYTPAGGRVLVRARMATDREHAGMVEIAVEDTGIGIPAQDLPRLTERFFRVDKARSRELGGTGLGLAIVKHIVQAHGGSLTITSALGQGTTVSAFFPAAQVAPAMPVRVAER